MRPRGNEAGSLCFCPLRVWCAGSTYCWGTPRSPESRDVAPTWSMLGWMRCCGSVALRVDACGSARGRFPAGSGGTSGGISGGISGGSSGGAPAFNGLDAGCCRVRGGVGVREAFASAYVIVKAARAAGKELCDGPAPRV